MSIINLIIRSTAIATGIVLFASCSAPKSRYSVQPSVDPAYIVQINQYFEIPNRKARVYIQDGKEISKRNIDKKSPYCSVLMQDLHKAGEPKLNVSPGMFEIIKLRKFNDYSQFPGTFTVSRRWDLDFPVFIIFEVEMRLASAEQPGVRSLICAKQVHVFSPVNMSRHYPNLAEIKATLSHAIEIKSP
jgi:hypothetical protein